MTLPIANILAMRQLRRSVRRIRKTNGKFRSLKLGRKIY